jgi:positive regulator of sigma E activity
MALLHAITAYLLPGIFALLGIALGQLLSVSAVCLIGTVLNHLHVFEPAKTHRRCADPV